MQKATIYKIKDISTLDEYHDVKEKYIGTEILIRQENSRFQYDNWYSGPAQFLTGIDAGEMTYFYAIQVE